MDDNDLARFIHRQGAKTGWDDENGEATPFLEAARRNNLELIRLFAPFGTDKNKEVLAARLLNKQKLFEEVKGRNEADLDLTLSEARKRGWGADVCDSQGRTPLSFAAENGFTEIVEKLLDNGANPELQDYDQHTPLLWAVWASGKALRASGKASEWKWLQVVRKLQYNIAIRALKASSRPGMLDVLDRDREVGLIRKFLFLDRNPDDDIDSDAWDAWRDPFETPELGEIAEVEKEALEIISTETLRVSNIHDNIMDRPLGLAAAFSSLELMKQLYHADRRLRDRKGRTPLCRAAELGNTAVIKLLISDEEAPIYILDQNRKSPLILAAENGHLHVVKLLVDNMSNSSLDWVDATGQTALSVACENGHMAVVTELLCLKPPRRPDINSKALNLNTPLIWAAEKCHVEVIRALYLLELEGVEVNTENKEGMTAMSYVIMYVQDTSDSDDDNGPEEQVIDCDMSDEMNEDQDFKNQLSPQVVAIDLLRKKGASFPRPDMKCQYYSGRRLHDIASAVTLEYLGNLKVWERVESFDSKGRYTEFWKWPDHGMENVKYEKAGESYGFVMI